MHFRIIGKLKEIEVVAAGRGIRELRRLRKVYGVGRWRKLKGKALVRFADDTVQEAEIHWYEASGIGKKELKIKRLIE